LHGCTLRWLDDLLAKRLRVHKPSWVIIGISSAGRAPLQNHRIIDAMLRRRSRPMSALPFAEIAPAADKHSSRDAARASSGPAQFDPENASLSAREHPAVRSFSRKGHCRRDDVCRCQGSRALWGNFTRGKIYLHSRVVGVGEKQLPNACGGAALRHAAQVILQSTRPQLRDIAG
jgi:hypothetical protein